MEPRGKQRGARPLPAGPLGGQRDLRQRRTVRRRENLIKPEEPVFFLFCFRPPLRSAQGGARSWTAFETRRAVVSLAKRNPAGFHPSLGPVGGPGGCAPGPWYPKSVRYFNRYYPPGGVVRGVRGAEALIPPPADLSRGKLERRWCRAARWPRLDPRNEFSRLSRGRGPTPRSAHYVPRRWVARPPVYAEPVPDPPAAAQPPSTLWPR